MIEYKIENKEKIEVIGKATLIAPEKCSQTIPQLWEMHNQSDDRKEICGMYGVLFDHDQQMEYVICDTIKETKENYIQRVIPGGLWAVFPCKGKLPDSLQKVNEKIWTEWIKENQEYKVIGHCVVENYTRIHEDYCEIWIQVEKK